MTQKDLSKNLSNGIANTLMRATAIQQSMSQMPDYKCLLKHFGDLLRRDFGVQKLGFARLGRQKTRLHMKRQYLKVDGVSSYSAEFWTEFEQIVAESGVLTSEHGDGLLCIEHAGQTFYTCITQDPKSKAGRLVVWQIPDNVQSQYDTFSIALLEFAVQALQVESKWYRKLAGTQSLLNIDDLTGLYNHRYLEICLENELRRADRFQNNFCLMFIDLDSFKPVNDQHGHLSGSNVLKQVADVIKDAVREVDIPIRYGGDEFVVLLLGASSSKGVLAGERVRRSIERTAFKVDGGATTHVTASIGIAAYPEHGKTKEGLLRIADESMYRSKKSGKNRVTILSVNASETLTK
jgi:diguanylate cyclase (GGDEF)-like protein